MKLLLSALLLLTATTCGQTESAGHLDTKLVFEESIEEEATLVRNLNGSLWGGLARFEEELSIGTLDGPDEYLFGSIACLSSDGERIFVVDRQVPVIRVYDWNGIHLMDVGGEGDGPGEYRGPSCIDIDPISGTIYVEDYRGPGRILSYDSDGNYLDIQTFLTTRYSSASLLVTTAGVLYMSGRWYLPGEDPRDRRNEVRGMILWEPGIATRDTILAPRYDYEQEMVWAMRNGRRSTGTGVPFWPDSAWEMVPSGAIVSGISNEYRFEVRHLDGSMTIVERYWDPIEVPDAHREFSKTRVISMLQQSQPDYSWNGPEVPRIKPVFRGFYGDHNGRIWVVRQGTSIHNEDGDETGLDYTRPLWEDEYILDAFEESGRYLGQVKVPRGLYPTRYGAFIQDDYMIARITGEDDVPYVKRYRLVLPGNSK